MAQKYHVLFFYFLIIIIVYTMFDMQQWHLFYFLLSMKKDRKRLWQRENFQDITSYFLQLMKQFPPPPPRRQLNLEIISFILPQHFTRFPLSFYFWDFSIQVLSVELDLWLWASGVQCSSLPHHRTLSIYYWAYVTPW